MNGAKGWQSFASRNHHDVINFTTPVSPELMLAAQTGVENFLNCPFSDFSRGGPLQCVPSIKTGPIWSQQDASQCLILLMDVIQLHRH